MAKSYGFDADERFKVDQKGWFKIVSVPSKDQVMTQDLMTHQFVVWQIEELQKLWKQGLLEFALSGDKEHGNLHKEPGQPFPTSYDFPELASLPEALQQETRDRLDLILPLTKLAPKDRTKPAIEARIREFVLEQLKCRISGERTALLFPKHNGNGRDRKTTDETPDEAQSTPLTVEITLPDDKEGQSKEVTASAVCARTVFRWLAKFEKSRQDPRSLVPGFYRRGKKETRLTPDQQKIVDDAVTLVFKTEERAPVTHVIERVKAEILKKNESRLTGEAEMPTPGDMTIRRYIDRLNAEDLDIARLGRSAAARKYHQPGLGPRPTRPNERWEMDTCIPDLLVVDDTDGLPIGRPRLTAVRDKYSGYPTGLSISFDPPSAFGALECLYHAILKKENARLLFNLNHEYLGWGVPEVLVVDRGREFVNKHVELACLQLGIEIQEMPGYSPWFKGSIERWFRTLQTDLIHVTPGTTFSNFLARGDYDSAKHACVTLDGLWYLLHKWVVDIYAESPRRGIGVPARLWERALEKDFVPRLPPSLRDLQILLSRFEKRTIRNTGIQFEHLFYQDSRLGLLRHRLEKGDRRKDLPESADESEKMKVVFKYNPRDLSRIWVLDPFSEPAMYLEIDAADQDYTQDLSLWKHRVITRYLAEEIKKQVDHKGLLRAKDALRQEIYEAFRYGSKLGARKHAARFLDIQVSAVFRGPQLALSDEALSALLESPTVETPLLLPAQTETASTEAGPAEGAVADGKSNAGEKSSAAAVMSQPPPLVEGVELLDEPAPLTAGTRLPNPAAQPPTPSQQVGGLHSSPRPPVNTDPDPETTFGIKGGFIRSRSVSPQEDAHAHE